MFRFDTPLKGGETGQVFREGDLGHKIDEIKIELPNSSWIAKHHKCVPIYYGYKYANGSIEKNLHIDC